ncbi:MAG TPA: methyltransferase domain-containing protein [Bryobacteraceae bacterium]
MESGQFICNVCGAKCERADGEQSRESAYCGDCGSSMRVRALVALLSTEIFGVPMALPEFPALKSIRGIGMSDSPELAARLAEKFDYTNTFYHQAPFFDVTHPDDRDIGRFDFIFSSEVMEHVPGPVADAFGSLARLLKPDGVLLLTTPYTIDGKTAEHFPELHEYTLAAPGGQTVLINRRRDGEVEIFQNLTFHGGHGSTLELRVFSEESLRQILDRAGFPCVHVASESFSEFGVTHSETWSLPIAARKGNFIPPVSELALEYREALRRGDRISHDLSILTGEYERHIAFHNLSHKEMKRELDSRLDWARKIETDLEERTKWALDLQKERTDAIKNYEQARKSELEAWQCVNALEKELDETRAQKTWLESRRWTRVGRRLKMLS